MLKHTDISAVIFDMDGLVLDTEMGYFFAWQQAANEMGYFLPESFFYALSGLSGTAIKEKLLEACGKEFDLARFKQLADRFWYMTVQQQGIAVKYGFHELLAFIREQELPYCLATNSPLQNALECLAFAGLEQTFDLIISRDQVAQGKPAPDIFLMAATKLQVPIQKCLVLEDSEAGLIAAVRAGAITVCVPSMPLNTPVLASCVAILPDLTRVLQAMG